MRINEIESLDPAPQEISSEISSKYKLVKMKVVAVILCLIVAVSCDDRKHEGRLQEKRKIFHEMSHLLGKLKETVDEQIHRHKFK